MAKGSEQASWAWSPGLKECCTCDKTLTLKEVREWRSRLVNGKWIREIRCYACFERAHGRTAA